MLPASKILPIVIATVLMLAPAMPRASADFPVRRDRRSGASVEGNRGQGWKAEAFLNIPDSEMTNLLTVERYVQRRTPDLTFRTLWIDFPSGPVGVDLDENFATLGDFLDDYIFDVSSPALLDEPFGNFLIRFKGFVKVVLEDGSQPNIGMPTIVDFGTLGADGYRMVAGESLYRQIRVQPNFPFFFENAFFFSLGMYPIEVTVFNRYDPGNLLGYGLAGIELYSWHGGISLPGGDNMVHRLFGPATLVPPRIIYQEEDIVPYVEGDFDGNYNIDLLDYTQLFRCFFPPISCPSGPGLFFCFEWCQDFDIDDDQDLDLQDFATIQSQWGQLPVPDVTTCTTDQDSTNGLDIKCKTPIDLQ